MDLEAEVEDVSHLAADHRFRGIALDLLHLFHRDCPTSNIEVRNCYLPKHEKQFVASIGLSCVMFNGLEVVIPPRSSKRRCALLRIARNHELRPVIETTHIDNVRNLELLEVTLNFGI